VHRDRQDRHRRKVCAGTRLRQTRFLAASAALPATRYALLTVTDSGSGIEAETREKIFEPFFTTKELGRGTGLGLSIIYGIIKQHEGYINCYSEIGKGTTFKIYLPLSDYDEVKYTDDNKSHEFIGGTETILYAEDDDLLRNLYTNLLKEYGYTIIEAINGEDAVRLFMSNKDTIDLIIVDMIMPVMSGKDAVSSMREVKQDLKVIFTSGYPADCINRDGTTKEGCGFISKPCSPTEFLRTVRDVIERKK